MTDELQADPITDTATPVEGSDLATDTGENQEPKITFTDEQQKVFDKAIGNKTFKQRRINVELTRQAERAALAPSPEWGMITPNNPFAVGQQSAVGSPLSQLGAAALGNTLGIL